MKEQNKIYEYKYIAVLKKSPDIPRAWGLGSSPFMAELNCQIAVAKKLITKLENGCDQNTIDRLEDYKIINEDDLEEEIEPYKTVYENGKWKSSKYRISFKD
tara:strand:+ start:449 stop:754 length:306 start_codon:yes stop_codon:yes gene_type:complete